MTPMDPATERQEAIDLFNLVWQLLETVDRSVEQDDRMLHAAHASRFHWGEVGDPVNLVRGEWQCSRVYAVLGRSEPALHHGRRCLDLCEEHGVADFDLAYAYEALARAHALVGDRDEVTRLIGLAEQASVDIADLDDREHLLRDLTTIPR